MVTLSTKAAEVVKGVKEKDNVPDGAALRLGITQDGCEGSGTPWRYQMDFDAEPPKEGDKVFDSEGVKVYVDQESLPRLQGLQLDVVEDLSGKRFLFRNPNAGHSCGCGKTFSEK